MGEAVVRLQQVAYDCCSLLDVFLNDWEEGFPRPVFDDFEEPFTTASFDASKEPFSFNLKHIARMSECREKTQLIFTRCPRLYLRLPNLLSSISIIFSGPPIFCECRSTKTLHTSRQKEYQSTIVVRERCPASSKASVCGRCRAKSQVMCRICSSVKLECSNHVPIRTDRSLLHLEQRHR